MAYEIIPGVRQDHRGRLYQNGRYPNGKGIEVPYTPGLPQEYPQLQTVWVESRTRPGVVFKSMQFLQGVTA